MSDSETESEPEPSLADTLSLSTFAQACGSRPHQAKVALKSVNWAMNTLTTLDFHDISLHEVVQECVAVMLHFIDMLLLPRSTLSDQDRTRTLADVSCSLSPTFLKLLFRYRRFFRAIAAKDLRPGFAVPTTICWVDIILAKLGDLSALVATDFQTPPSDESFTNVLAARQQEDRLKAALQLPDNWDMVPSLLTSDRASPAAKRLVVQVLFGSYVLYPRISGSGVGREFSPRSLPTALTEHILSIDRQTLEPVATAGQGYQLLVEQDRLVHAMVLTLLAVTSMSLQIDAEAHAVPPFRPRTNSAIIRSLNFIMDRDDFTPPIIFCPLEELNVASSLLVHLSVVPLWCLGVWVESQSLRADIFIQLVLFLVSFSCKSLTARARQRLIYAFMGSIPTRCDDVFGGEGPSELLTRCTAVLSTDSPPTGSLPFIMDVLHNSCLLVRRSLVAGGCGSRYSTGYCKALLVLALQLCRMEQSTVVNNLVIQNLSLMRDSSVCEGWKLARGDSSIPIQTIIDEAVAAAGVSLAQIPVEQDRLLQVQQLMQLLSIIVSKGIDDLEDQSVVSIAESVGRNLHSISREKSLLHETFLIFATIIRQCCPGYNNNESSQVLDVEMMRHIGSETRDLVVASAVSVYIMSTPLLESSWYLGAWEYLSDTLLLVKSHFYEEDELLALAVGPTICDALLFLVNHVNEHTISYIRTSPKTKALCKTLKHSATCESGGSLERVLFNAEQRESHGPVAKSRLNLGYQVALREYRSATRLTLVHKPSNEVGEGREA
ncbi:hypothetical protein EV401DRAFT_2065131 [Pisolithus croceorrhizus]|nr:hypothetical protein EV401DRAFT_2065131 [Pisolithus croceorrhizus]